MAKRSLRPSYIQPTESHVTKFYIPKTTVKLDRYGLFYFMKKQKAKMIGPTRSGSILTPTIITKCIDHFFSYYTQHLKVSSYSEIPYFSNVTVWVERKNLSMENVHCMALYRNCTTCLNA